MNKEDLFKFIQNVDVATNLFPLKLLNQDEYMDELEKIYGKSLRSLSEKSIIFFNLYQYKLENGAPIGEKIRYIDKYDSDNDVIKRKIISVWKCETKKWNEFVTTGRTFIELIFNLEFPWILTGVKFEEKIRENLGKLSIALFDISSLDKNIRSILNGNKLYGGINCGNKDCSAEKNLCKKCKESILDSLKNTYEKIEEGLVNKFINENKEVPIGTEKIRLGEWSQNGYGQYDKERIKQNIRKLMNYYCWTLLAYPECDTVVSLPATVIKDIAPFGAILGLNLQNGGWNDDTIDVIWALKESIGTGLDAKAQLVADERRKESIHHALRSAVAAIMSRNMSHNIGSHVLNYLSNPEELGKLWVI